MVGYESKDRRYMDEWTNAIYITDPKKSVQINGKLVSWEIFAKKTGTIYLQVRHFDLRNEKCAIIESNIANRFNLNCACIHLTNFNDKLDIS